MTTKSTDPQPVLPTPDASPPPSLETPRVGQTCALQNDVAQIAVAWLMRAGLNLGNLSFCNSLNDIKVMSDHGFERVNGVFLNELLGGHEYGDI